MLEGDLITGVVLCVNYKLIAMEIFETFKKRTLSNRGSFVIQTNVPMVFCRLLVYNGSHNTLQIGGN